MKKYLILPLLILFSAATVAGCSSEKPVQITSLKLNEKDLELAVGGTFQLVATTRPADAGATIEWTSSDEAVATVDQSGLVTLRAFGTATITARYRSYSARCSVATLQGAPLDPSAALAATVSDNIIYSRDVLLYAQRRIMQGFDLTGGGGIYYSQVSSDASSVNICYAPGPGQNAQTDYMVLKYFGHGTQIVAEEASDGKTYIWLNSNASVDASGEYGNNWSVSRVEFTPGATYDDGYAGETFFLNKDDQFDQQVAIDFGARRLLIGSRRSGVRYFWIFDLDEALALPLKKMTATVTVGAAGSDPVTREIQARDLGDCRVLGSFSVSAGTDKEHDVYSYSHQGHEVAGNYVYFYEGNAVEESPDQFVSKAYVTVFNYSGKIVVPRTEVAAIADKTGLAAAGLTASGYAEAESLKIRGGKLYLGVACRDGASSDRRANILVYDCVQQQ
ncbi:Ig-like domain-containing protein [uncultured Alistipes sp.]|uniref:Ig-like domain-containing protein n=1 Tax=uncultured Alistipes sp. TaxID=538949 RepID=UPI0025DE6648|nr:Ig-like domain-containing protein [uncultured Alistipes sp.]